MNTERILMTNKTLEVIFLAKANMYPQNHSFYNYLISRDHATHLELKGLIETAFFLRGGIDDIY